MLPFVEILSNLKFNFGHLFETADDSNNEIVHVSGFKISPYFG